MWQILGSKDIIAVAYKFNNFERKYWRNLEEKGKWRIRYNEKLYQLYQTRNVLIIKVSRLGCVGYVKRIDVRELTKAEGIRSRGEQS